MHQKKKKKLVYLNLTTQHITLSNNEMTDLCYKFRIDLSKEEIATSRQQQKLQDTVRI